MTAQPQDATSLRTNSAGTALSQTGWLDVHFEASRAEYETQLRAVGIGPGWHVLDAGTGSGSYLPWLAELVGPAGRVTALDLAPENIQAVEERLARWSLSCPVETCVGDLLALPYLDNHFDAVWFANTAQYFSPDELLVILAGFRRVTRPGGLVAVKDTAGIQFYNPHTSALNVLIARLLMASYQADDSISRQFRNVLYRTPTLRQWMERAGLQEVWQLSTTIERWAPLPPMERQWTLNCVHSLAAAADHYQVSEADTAEWMKLRDPQYADHPANHPDSHYCEGNVLAVGRVPDER